MIWFLNLINPTFLLVESKISASSNVLNVPDCISISQILVQYQLVDYQDIDMFHKWF